MSRQAKDMFHECKEIPNSPPNIFLNGTRRPTIDSTTESDHYKYIFGQPLRNLMIWRTLKQLLKNEDVLKMARNEIAKLIRTVNFLLQKQQQSLFITKQSRGKLTKSSRSIKCCFGKRARTNKLQITIFHKTTPTYPSY